MIPCSSDFIDAVKNPIKQLYLKMEFYDNKMSLLTGFEQDVTKYQNFSNGIAPSHFTPYGSMRRMSAKRLGGISVDMTRPILRSFSFSMDTSDGKFNWGTDSLVWIANRVKIYIGLKLANGDIEYLPQGVFIITSPSDSHNPIDGQSVTIAGQDKAYLFTDKRGKFANELTISKGTKIRDAIMKIAKDGGETMFNFGNVDDTIPSDMTFQGTDNRWNAMTQLATIARCTIFYDVNGYLRLQEIATDFSKESSVWSYKYGDPSEKFYAGNVRNFDETNLANHIRVIGGSSQTPTIVYDLVVDETIPYTLSYTIEEMLQFQAGVYNNVANIPLNTSMQWTETYLNNVAWTGIVDATIYDNSLTNTATTAGWGNSGAFSSQVISTGANGYMQTVVKETNTARAIGISSKSSVNYTDIDYAFYLDSNANLRIFEGGVEIVGQFGTYASNDVLRIEVQNNSVTYKKNDAVVYTSTKVPTYPLYVDASLHDLNATLDNVILTTYLNQTTETVGGIQLATIGTAFDETNQTYDELKVGIDGNLIAFDDTEYSSQNPIKAGHVELIGYRRDWGDQLLTGQTRFGQGSSDTASSTSYAGQYMLTSANGVDAKSRLNNGETVQDLQISVSITVPNAPASGVAHAGVVYRTTEWIDADNTFGYYAGLGTDGKLIFGYGSNSSTGLWTQLQAIDLSNTANVPNITAGSVHTLKIVVSGTTHTISIDGTQEISITDATYSGAGSYGLRVFNGTAEFDNFGMFPSASSMSGIRLNTYDLSAVKNVGATKISWTDSLPTPSTTLAVDVSFSTDGGTTWSVWTSATSGGSIPTLTIGQDLSTTKMQVRETLTTTDAAWSPKLESIEITLNSEFVASGDYTSEAISITTTSVEPLANSSVIGWSANVPTNTTLGVQLSVSTDGGKTFSPFSTVNNGDVIKSITDTVDISQCLFKVKVSMTTSDQTITPSLMDLTVQADAPIWKNNPYSIQKIGDVLYVHNNGSADALITTNAQAKWRAKYELMHRLGYIEQLNCELAPIWIHDAYDIVEIEDSSNNVTGNYQLQSYTLPLVPQLIEATLIKYVNPINDWNAI